MKIVSKRLLVTAIIAGLASPVISHATNGYFMIGYGAKSRGMGGVGVAEGVSGMAAAFNPATMADVGTRFDIGGDLFWAPNVVTHSDGTLGESTTLEESKFPNTAFSQSDIFIVPAMGATYQYSDDITLGFAFFGAGLGTQYNQALPAGDSSYFFNFNGLGGDDNVGIKLMQVQIPLSIAYKLNEQHTVGASLVIGMQLFEAWGLGAFGSDGLGLAADASADKVTNNGTDTSYGAGFRLGYTGKYLENDLILGVNYSSRVYMTEFDEYSGLFAEQGDFDIPEHYAVGIAYKGFNKFDIKFDIQRINYSDIASVGNPGPLSTNTTEFNPLCPGQDTDVCKLGGDLGMGFGWTDQTVFKFGVEYEINSKFAIRGGANYAETTIQEDQILFNLLAPATIETHVTAGLTYKIKEDIELSASYVYGFENTIEGQTLFQPLGSNPDITTSNAAISMKQSSLGVTLGIKW